MKPIHRCLVAALWLMAGLGAARADYGTDQTSYAATGRFDLIEKQTPIFGDCHFAGLAGRIEHDRTVKSEHLKPILCNQFATRTASERAVPCIANSGRSLHGKKSFSFDRHIECIIGNPHNPAAMVCGNRIKPGAGAHVTNLRLCGAIMDPPDLTVGIILNDREVFFETSRIGIGQIVGRNIRPQRFDQHPRCCDINSPNQKITPLTVPSTNRYRKNERGS